MGVRVMKRIKHTKKDEKQIKEIQTEILRWGKTADKTGNYKYTLSEHLYKVGYRRIPDGAVILTKEEIAALNEYQKKHCSGGESVEG
jgi:hypothetical protein